MEKPDENVSEADNDHDSSVIDPPAVDNGRKVAHWCAQDNVQALTPGGGLISPGIGLVQHVKKSGRPLFYRV